MSDPKDIRSSGEQRRRWPILSDLEPKEFPQRIYAETTTFPALIKPWIGGIRAYWIDALQAFQLYDNNLLVRVNHTEPQSRDTNLLGEFFNTHLDRDAVMVEVLSGKLSIDTDFVIFDAELPEQDAISRAEFCGSIQDSPHVGIAQMFQVNKNTSFNSWLKQWRLVRFPGALAVPWDAPWLHTESEISKPIA